MTSTSTSNSNSTSTEVLSACFSNPTVFIISVAYKISKHASLTPLCVLVLYHGFQQWRQERSFQTSAHSDIFAYHMVAIELIATWGFTVYLDGIHTGDSELFKWGFYSTSIALPGEILIHCLTCVERYLAVVHPVTYLRLRQRGGARIRNVSIGCVWIVSFGFIVVTANYYPDVPHALHLCILVLSLILIWFCSLSVLLVLIRPGPGGGNRDRADQSKQKAFHTIMVILGVLLLWLLTVLITFFLQKNMLLSYTDRCVLFACGLWFNIPSSLVLPLLFLQRAGKLVCC